MTRLKAVNSIGWEIQEFSMPQGWKRCNKFQDVFTSYHKAYEALVCIETEDIGNFRVYEALEL